MRRTAIIFAAFAAAVLLAGCQKEYAVAPSPSSVVFSAEIGTMSKTTLDGVQVKWEAGDEIDVMSGSGVVTYVATPDPSDPRKATFAKKHSDDPEPTPLPSNLGIGKYAALYPSGIVDMDFGVPAVYLPAVQRYNAPGSLKNINVMFASSNDFGLSFQNGFGILALNIKGDKTVTDIVVETRGNNVSGLFDISSFSMSSDPDAASKSVKLDCGSGVKLTSDGVKFYVGIPALTVPKGELTVTVNASDGTSATLVNKGAAATFRMGHVSPYTWTPEFEAAPEMQGDDWLAKFKAGENVAVGGRNLNIAAEKRFASVRLSQLSSGSQFVSDFLGGQYDVIFLDYDPRYDEGADKITISGGNTAIPAGTAIVGRYSTHQSELVFDGSIMSPNGSLALRNVCIRTNVWAIQTKDMQKPGCRFDIEDCSFFISPPVGVQGGLVTDNCTSTGDISTVLGSFALKNSVVVRRNDYNHAMFTMLLGSYGTIPYKDFVIENNAFIYESDIAGREVCTSNLFYLSSDSEVKNSTLNFTFRNNSVLGYKGSGTIVSCCDPVSIVCDNNVIEAKLSSRVFFLNIIYPYSKLKPATSSLNGNYANNTGAVVSGVDFLNGSTLKAKFNITTQSLVVSGVTPFIMLDSSIGYLAADPSVVPGAGCTYETKKWRSWSTDNAGGTEGYGTGHGAGDFGWQ